MLIPKISPSLMCVDFKNLTKSIEELNDANVDYFHIDVMDGVFVPNITLSPDLCKTIRELTDVPFDFHFMICNPINKIEWFGIKENDLVSIHIEAETNIKKYIDNVKKLKAKVGIAVSPDTPMENIYQYINEIDFVVVMTVYPGFAGQKLVEKCLPKIQEIRNYADSIGRTDLMIEVDGNVSFENAIKMRKLGADIFVGGSSSIFKKDNTIQNNTQLMREKLKEVY